MTSPVPLYRVAAVSASVIAVAGLWVADGPMAYAYRLLFVLGGIAAGMWLAGRVGTSPSERQWLRNLFLFALAARIVLVVALYRVFLVLYPESKGLFFYELDPMLFANVGEALADQWMATGIAPMASIPISSPGQYVMLRGESAFELVFSFGLLYLNAAVYYVFGNDLFLLVSLSCLSGAILSMLIYSIASAFCAPATARMAACLAAFYPGLLLYSGVPYKDIHTALLLTFVLWTYLQIKEGFRFWKAFLLIAGFLALLFIRWTVGLPFVITVLLSGVLDLRNTRRYGFMLALGGLTLVSLSLFMAGLLTMASHAELLYETTQGSFDRATESYGEEGVTSFYRFTAWDIVNWGNFLPAILVTLGLVLIVPFPGWVLLHPDQPEVWLWLPEMVLWHGLLPFLFIGMYRAWRGEVQVPRILLITTGFSLIALSLGTLGSMSAVYYRVIIMPILLLLIAVGLEGLQTSVRAICPIGYRLLAGSYYFGLGLANIFYVAYRWP
jgi:hypothetical protein